MLRPISSTQVRTDNPYTESLFRTVKCRRDHHHHHRRPFTSAEEACAWVASFVDWYNHQHRHSSVRFVTPSQRHGREAVAISRHRVRVYKQARARHPRRLSRSTRCWRQPEVVWINPPPPENGIAAATLLMAA